MINKGGMLPLVTCVAVTAINKGVVLQFVTLVLASVVRAEQGYYLGVGDSRSASCMGGMWQFQSKLSGVQSERQDSFQQLPSFSTHET